MEGADRWYSEARKWRQKPNGQKESFGETGGGFFSLSPSLCVEILAGKKYRDQDCGVFAVGVELTTQGGFIRLS